MAASCTACYVGTAVEELMQKRATFLLSPRAIVDAEIWCAFLLVCITKGICPVKLHIKIPYFKRQWANADSPAKTAVKICMCAASGSSALICCSLYGSFHFWFSFQMPFLFIFSLNHPYTTLLGLTECCELCCLFLCLLRTSQKSSSKAPSGESQ